MTSPKIAFCFYACTGGVDGAERWHQRMLPRLQSMGLNILAICYRVSPGACRLSRDLALQRIPLREVDATGVPPSVGLQRLLGLLGEERPALVSVNHLMVAALSSLWGRPHGIRYLMMIRDDFALFWNLAERFLWGDPDDRADGVTCVSRELQRRLDARTDGSVERLCCPSSVVLPRHRATWTEGEFRVVYLGRMDNRQKRVDVLARSLIRLSRQWPWLTAVLYGDGPDTEHVKEILSSDVGHRVAYGGLLPGDRVYPTLQSAQALILLSAHEGLSTAMQEAMANGLPVIIKRMSSGFDGIVTHRDSAWVLETDDDLESAIQALRTDRSLWERLSHRGRAIAQQRFSLDHAAIAWAEFLKRVANGASPQGFDPPALTEIEQTYTDRLGKWGPLDSYERWLVARRDPGALTGVLCDPAIALAQREWLLQLSVERGLLNPELHTRCLAGDWGSAGIGLLLDHAIQTGLEIAPVIRQIEADRLPLLMRNHLLQQIHLHERLPPSDVARLALRLIDAYRLDAPLSQEEIYNTASLHRLAGRHDTAEAMFTQLADSGAPDTRRAGCLFHVGQIRLARGAVAAARAALTACLHLLPEHRRAAQLLAQIDDQGRDSG